MAFFDGFSFDTLLSIISCGAGVTALFLGGAAYKNCKIMRDSFNDKKEFGENSTDSSIKAYGDVTVNNGMNNNQLSAVAAEFSSITTANVSGMLDLFRLQMQEQHKENLKVITDKAMEIIQENKLQIGGYTKVDWINIYLEGAKVSSTSYMQDVWAKVLALELSFPDSISFKTIETLKTMSEDDFKLFERLCLYEIDGFILQESYFYNKYQLPYVSLLQLQEFGLLNMDLSSRTYTIEPQGVSEIVYGDLAFIIHNPTGIVKKFSVSIHLLTNVANELKKLIGKKTVGQYAVDVANEWWKDDKDLKISIHRVNSIENGHLNYQTACLYCTP